VIQSVCGFSLSRISFQYKLSAVFMAVWLTCILGISSTANSEETATESKISLRWESREIEGWKVHLSRRFKTDEKQQLDKAMKLLQVQLKEIITAVPSSAVTKLREVPLWFSPEYPGIGPRAEYHPNGQWLKENGRDTCMEKGIEFTNVQIFEADMRRMPNFALHELAHAYHDRIYGFDHKEIATLYERAKASGSYDRVERQDSEGIKTLDRAYALTNPMEYFAETSEAFFSRNDFFPFNREELHAHDPQMEQLLDKLWKQTSP
jgi:dipeptidyl-peptidase-4